MADFSQQIQNFQRYGVYQYKFDSTGNLTFDSSALEFSHVYLSCPLRNVVYDTAKLKSLVDCEFNEFVPASPIVNNSNSDEMVQQLNVLVEENDALKTRLETLTTASESSETDATRLATKQVIIELRKLAGQGRVETDFSDDFPYAPIKKESA